MLSALLPDGRRLMRLLVVLGAGCYYTGTRQSSLGAVGMTGVCQRLLIVLSFALLGLQGAAASTAEYTGPPLIEIVGESGKQSETRTIRFQTTGTPKIRFEPKDLTRSSPAGLPRALIDSGQIRFTPPAAPRVDAEGSATFTVVIDALPARYGVFTGDVDIVINDKRAGTIKLQLNVQYPAAQPLATEPKTLSKSSGAAQLPARFSNFLRPSRQGGFSDRDPGLAGWHRGHWKRWRCDSHFRQWKQTAGRGEAQAYQAGGRARS
jgi:hypothetical protein